MYYQISTLCSLGLYILSVVADQDVSQYGVVGMAGSLWEWVADIGQYGPDNAVTNGTFKDQGAGYGNDGTWNVAGAAYTNNTSQGTNVYVTGLPAALICGGNWAGGANAGVFAFLAANAPSGWNYGLGFCCASARQ